MSTPDSVLDKEVTTRNLVNRTANELQLQIQELLRPYTGQKIIKVTPYRTATKKIKEILDKVQLDLQARGFRLVFEWGYSYTVYAVLDKTYQATEYSVNYVKRNFYICSIDGDILSDEWKEVEPARTDYTAQEVRETRKKIQELKEQTSALESTIREFR